MAKCVAVLAAFVCALALNGCGDPPRSPGHASAGVSQPKKKATNAAPSTAPSSMQPAKSNLWKDNSLPEPLEGADQYKPEFVQYLHGTSENYRWNRLDDKMASIGISNLDGSYAAFNGKYYPHPNRPFLWVKQESDYKAGLLKDGDNHVIRFYKRGREDGVDAPERCWWIGVWKINRKALKPSVFVSEELTWHCQSYNTFTQVPERGWKGEAGNKMHIDNEGADRQVADK